MQTARKGDRVSPGPANCILRRSNEENTAHAGLISATGPGARCHVAKRRGSPSLGEESVCRRLHRNREGRGKPHRGGTGRQSAKGQLVGGVGPYGQSGICILFLADTAPIRGAELPGWTAEPARLPQ